MTPVNTQCWLNVGWELTEFIIRIAGEWGSWGRSWCSLSQEIKCTGVWEASHNLQCDGSRASPCLPLRITAFLQFCHCPPPPFSFSVTAYVKSFNKRSYTGYPLCFSCLVHRKWKKYYNCFSSKWGNISNKSETCYRDLVGSLVSDINPVEFGINVDS